MDLTTPYLPATLRALAREERRGRRTPRLTEGGWPTWDRFRGRLGLGAFVELLLEDAAVTQPLPFAWRRVLGASVTTLALSDDDARAALTDAAARRDDDGDPSAYMAAQAQLLGLGQRLAFHELRRLQPHHRVLELPGTGGRLAQFVVGDQPGIFFHDVFRVACATPSELALAGIAAVECGVVGEPPIDLDPDLEKARATGGAFSHVFGLRPDKGGRFSRESLLQWFPSADVVLV